MPVDTRTNSPKPQRDRNRLFQTVLLRSLVFAMIEKTFVPSRGLHGSIEIAASAGIPPPRAAR